ncbi:MAG: DNA mismatch repair protein MutS [Bacteroides sp.]|nr:DNA mismatch repair protein MutS [Bacteroides sp.]MCM1413041.1 DNA mismatch repair protein MutS [Bacteroides sp.]MCM1471747.1 DNA mismatch repair protein MutS [Bacteroides sp.]
MAKKVVETPLMKQYFEMKQKHPDAVLLFRVGDFYETFSDDAITASEILGITLTRRANGAASSVELAGFPHHALDTYLPKLIRAGKRVAICEQLEDPKLTKKLVKRGITELVTPGVSLSDNILENRRNNFLAAVAIGDKQWGVAFLDISTGEFLTGEGSAEYVEKLLAKFGPKEVLIERGRRKDFNEHVTTTYLTFELEDWVWTEPTGRERLMKQFQTGSLKGYGIDRMTGAVIASGAILHYLDLTNHTQTGHIAGLSRIDEEQYVRLDSFTIRNLELVEAMASDGKSLLDVIDRTVTPMGARMLRRWVLFPLKDVATINSRLDVVEEMMRRNELREQCESDLTRIGDLERLIGKVAVGRVSPRELVQLRHALSVIGPLKAELERSDNTMLHAIGEQLNPCDGIRDRITREIVNDPPAALNRGDVIGNGVDAELDELRHIARSGKEVLMQIQTRESSQTGITSLKIGYNNVFGYYIEVTNTHRDKVPQEWIRKQTLVNAERYITPELKEYEEKILGAQEKIAAIEARLYAELVAAVGEYIQAIQLDALLIARLDCLLSLTKAAMANHYCRPTVDDSLTLKITEGRHPVIERELPVGERYITNSVELSNDGTQIMMITGPNMSGKSALLRQTALTVLMAQIGSFVAADNAHIGIVDKIFTRVGASDNISHGESTFMVEMTEAASILNNLSQRSLVLFDELGRGTSTYDGISIAWAIVEHIHEHPSARAKTLFATHYHELNEMEKSYRRIVNYNVSVKEIDGKVVFLRKLVKGGSEHSFGIHVAKLAGMPAAIVKRADAVLSDLEKSHRSGADNVGAAVTAQPAAEDGVQLSFFQLDDPVLSQIRDEILNTDINNLTPMAALNKLNDIKSILTGKSS